MWSALMTFEAITLRALVSVPVRQAGDCEGFRPGWNEVSARVEEDARAARYDLTPAEHSHHSQDRMVHRHPCAHRHWTASRMTPEAPMRKTYPVA